MYAAFHLEYFWWAAAFRRERNLFTVRSEENNTFKRVQFVLKNTQNTSFLNLSLTVHVVHLPLLINSGSFSLLMLQQLGSFFTTGCLLTLHIITEH